MAAPRTTGRRPRRAARVSALATVAPPRPPTLFVGRDRERGLLERGLARVPVAVVCGLAGVGKSSLAYAVAARWPGPTVHAVAGRGLGALVDELRRRTGGPVAELRTDDERCAALAARLDDTGALAVVDDLHRLPPAEQPRLLAAIGTRLTRGRRIATSREWPAAAQGYDRVEVHLGGLPARAARALWAALDQLRGATAGFTRAFESTGGNPFLLRRRHAGDPSGPEPLAQAIAALAPDRARLLGVIALARTSLTADQAVAIAGVDGKAAIADLRRALLIDLDGDRRALVHELVREAAAAALPDPVRPSCTRSWPRPWRPSARSQRRWRSPITRWPPASRSAPAITWWRGPRICWTRAPAAS